MSNYITDTPLFRIFLVSLMLIGLAGFASAMPTPTYVFNNTITPTTWYDDTGIGRHLNASAGAFKNSTDIPHANYTGYSNWLLGGNDQGTNIYATTGCAEDYTLTLWAKINNTAKHNILILGSNLNNVTSPDAENGHYDWFVFNNASETSPLNWVNIKPAGDNHISKSYLANNQWYLLVYKYWYTGSRWTLEIANATNRSFHTIINGTSATTGCPLGVYDGVGSGKQTLRWFNHWTAGTDGFTGKLYNIRMYRGDILNGDEMRTLLLGNFSAPPPPPASNVINIIRPATAQVITNYTTSLLFNVTGGASSYSINISIDGVFDSATTISNNTNKRIWFNFTEGTHTLFLSNASNKASFNSSRTFTLRYFNYTTEFNKVQDEAISSFVNITLYVPPEITTTNGKLILNYTNNISFAYTLFFGNEEKYIFDVPYQIYNTNNTIYDLNFNITVTTPLGTQYNTTNGTTHIIYTHYPNSILTPSSEVVEGDNYTVYGYATVPSSPVNASIKVYEDGIYKFTDNYGTGTTNLSFSGDIIATLTGMNETKNVSVYFNFSRGGYERVIHWSPEAQIIIYKMNFTTCVTGGLVILSKDELDNTFLATANYSVKVSGISGTINRNFSFYINNSANVTVCPRPLNISILADIDILVLKQGYEKGEKTINDRLINNTVPSIYYVYLIQTGRASVTSVRALGTYDAPLINHIIRVQKYFYDETAYIDIFSARTDTDGKIVPYLNWFDTYYKFIVADADNNILEEFQPQIVDKTPIDLKVGEGGTSFSSVYYDIQHNCSYNNNTKILRCSVIDNSGTVTKAMLKVYRNVVFSSEVLCNNNATGSSVTLICDLSGTGADSFTYTLTAHLTGYSPHILEFGSILKRLTGTYGSSGYFTAFLVTGSLALIGLSISPIASIIMGLVGFIITGVAGLFPLGNPVESGAILVSVVLIGGILIMIIRR